MICAGVYLSLNGTNITNNSYVDIDSIGSDDNGALICHTDCCMSPNVTAEGNWYYPNGTVVRTAKDYMDDNASAAFFVSNRSQREIHLLRTMNNHSAIDSERLGHFYCVITDTNDTNHTLFINICELHLCLAFIHRTSSAIQ